MEASRDLFKMLIKSQQPRLDLADLGVFQLIDELERVRQLWKHAEEGKIGANEELLRTEKLLDETKKKCTALEMEIKEMRTHMRLLMEENKAFKLDLNVYETRERQLKDAMKNGAFDTMTKEDRETFAFLREPLVRTYSKRLAERNPNFVLEEEEEDSENIDYDQTGDSIDDEEIEEVIHLRNGREYRRSSTNLKNRRSSSAHPHVPTGISNKRSRSRALATVTTTIEEEPVEGTPPKRSRDASRKLKEEVTTTTTTTTTTMASAVPSSSRGRETNQRSVHRSMTRRSMSVDSVPAVKPAVTPAYGLNNQFTKSTLDMRSSRTPMAPSWTTDVTNDAPFRRHAFVDAGIRVTKCDECHTTITLFSGKALRCKDCHQEVHKNCATRLPLPCIPRQKCIATPKSAGRTNKRVYRLQDFCTQSKPMIPFPVVHCVIALERKGLHVEGLYRVPGSKTAVLMLLNELRTSRSVPRLHLQDPEVITETLKRFLDGLLDPLVPRTSRDEFITAAALYTSDPDAGMRALNKAICELPQPHRDTMAYLFVHWEKVVASADMNKMPARNMARVLAPCVMGQPAHKLETMRTATQDAADCENAMMALFAFDSTYWRRFLSTINDRVEVTRNDRTPNALDRSILGPRRRPTHHLLGGL
ncbi:unnamed protein product [Caenorhabditis auriculariae]|uniref:Uncharacterized protein n=1 Tax=Caenorhabditis auriculariae TaxID=2777116 RepID=A0A8S1HTG2_9PELO|nr:unnamed protein product [Caenorhabditis auriculariae]